MTFLRLLTILLNTFIKCWSLAIKMRQTRVLMHSQSSSSSSHYSFNTKHHNWYVIGEKKDFLHNKLYKKTIWNNDFVVWRMIYFVISS